MESALILKVVTLLYMYCLLLGWKPLVVVFASLVQSGFLPPKQATMNCNWSRTDPDIVGIELDHLGLVFCSPWN